MWLINEYKHENQKTWGKSKALLPLLALLDLRVPYLRDIPLALMPSATPGNVSFPQWQMNSGCVSL